MGAPADVVEAVRARPSAEDFEYYDDTKEAVLLFCGLFGQWNIVGTMAGAMRTGLNYSGVQAAMHMLGIKSKRRAALFRDIQIMERAALDVFIEEASARRP